MKLIINADGVQKLIEIDPDGTVELANNACAQVAVRMADEITKEQVATRARTLLSGTAVREDLLAYGRSLIAESVKNAVEARMDSATVMKIVEVHRTAQQEFIKHIESKVMEGLAGKIDALIRERFAAAFGGVK